MSIGTHVALPLVSALFLAGLTVQQQKPPDRSPDVLIVLPAKGRAIEGLVVRRASKHEAAAPELMPSRAHQRQPGTEVLVIGACRPGDRLYLETAQVVALPIELDERGCNDPIAAPLYPRAELGGSISVSSLDPLPKVVELIARPCSAPTAPAAAHRIMAAVTPTGEWSAAVPADCLQVTIGAAGFASSTLPSVGLTLAQIKGVGVVHLSRGATLRLSAIDRRQQALVGMRVHVVLASRFDAALEALIRGASVDAMAEAVIGPAGTAVFTGLKPKPIYVVVTAESGDFAVTGPIELRQGSESSVAVADRPVGATAVVSAATAAEDPADRMSLIATPRIAGAWRGAVGVRVPLPAAEAVKLHLPTTGEWRFQLAVERQSLASVVAEENRVVQSGEPVRVGFDVRLTRYRGQVRLGGQPVAVNLQFSRPTGNHPPAYGRSNDNGEFAVDLTEPGSYHVRATSPDQSVAAFTEVQAWDPSVSLDLELPRGTITGIVLTDGGAPDVNARIQLGRLDAEDSASYVPIQTQADQDGTFRVDGVSPGRWELVASSGPAASEPAVVTVEENRTTKVTLKTQSVRYAFGRVTTRSGNPVPGADGMLWTVPKGLSAGTGGAIGFRTDLTGRFRAKLSRAGVERINIFVNAPGRGVYASLRNIDSAAIDIVLPEGNGELRITVPSTVDANRLNLLCLLSDDGGIINLSSILGTGAAYLMGGADNRQVIIPRLASGQWMLARFASVSDGPAYLAGVGGAMTVLDSVQVSPLSQTTVVIRN